MSDQEFNDYWAIPDKWPESVVKEKCSKSMSESDLEKIVSYYGHAAIGLNVYYGMRDYMKGIYTSPDCKNDRADINY